MDTILFVPGMGSDGSYEETLSSNCRLIVFDYAFRSSVLGVLNFLTDNYTFLTTDRVNRLQKQIEELYSRSKNFFIMAHSHGALLTHNALKNLGQKHGRDYTKKITVSTFGPAKAIATCHKKYVLKDATNVFYENDWILKRFKNKPFLKLKKDEWGNINQITYNNCDFKIFVKSAKYSPCAVGHSIKDQIESHRCYFDDLVNQQKKEFCGVQSYSSLYSRQKRYSSLSDNSKLSNEDYKELKKYYDE